MSEYDTDLLVWSTHQAELLRRMGAGERVNDQVDWENLAEEIESLGRSEKRALENRVATILVHLVKLSVSSAEAPRGGWQETIFEQRRRLARILRDNPSLRRSVAQVIADELPGAREQASIALHRYGEPPVSPELSFSEDQVLGPWLPE